jgi:hypothetical protein
VRRNEHPFASQWIESTMRLLLQYFCVHAIRRAPSAAEQT